MRASDNEQGINKQQPLGKVPWLWKSSLIVENFIDSEKHPWLWKTSLIVEKFLGYGVVPWL